jgi:hypothetical protein
MDNIMTDLRKTGCEGRRWMEPVQKVANFYTIRLQALNFTLLSRKLVLSLEIFPS